MRVKLVKIIESGRRYIYLSSPLLLFPFEGDGVNSSNATCTVIHQIMTFTVACLGPIFDEE